MMTRMYEPRRGTSIPAIFSTARQNIIEWTLEQIPQTRSSNAMSWV